jgi:WD40 repeat protein
VTAEIATLAEGAMVGRFVIVRQLGAGGMGTVYEARDPELSRSVAVKLMREPDRHLAMRLLREAQALAQLQHPNVVTVYELGIQEDQLFIAMELVDGESLDRYFARGRSSWRSVVALFVQAARGLAAAHAKGLVHRDVKPANLFVDESGRVRVGDFGLAKLVDDPAPDDETEPALVARQARADAMTASGNDAPLAHAADQTADPPTSGLLGSTLTRAGALLGTPMFMAPEQHLGRRGTAASDQFSFCVAMWRALFGVHPFEGSGEALADAIASGRRRETSTGRVPRWLVHALDRGLEREPAARHPSMAALVRTFERGMSRRRAIVAGVLALFGVIITLSVWRVVVEMRRADREASIARARADEATLGQASVTLATDPTASLALLRQLGAGAPQWRAARTVAADALSRGVARVFEHPGAARLAFSLDGTRLASCAPGMIAVWELATGAARTFGGPRFVLACEFTASGALVTVDGDGAIDRYDLATGAATRLRAVTGGSFTRAVLSPEARRLVIIDERHDGRLLDLERPGEAGDVALTDYAQAAWSPDGSALVAFDHRNQRLARVEPETGLRTEIKPVPVVLALATDGARAWIGSWEGRIVEVTGSPAVDWVSGHRGPITALLPLADGGLVSASSTLRFQTPDGDDVARDADYTITISDVSPNRTAHLRGHEDELVALAATRGGDRIASADAGGTIRVWERAPVRLARSDGHTVTFAATITADRSALVVATRGPVLEVRDALGRTAAAKLAIVDGPAGFVPPPSSQVSRLTKVGTRRVLEQLEGSTDSVTALVQSTTGRRIATLDTANRAVVWDLETRRGRLLAEQVTHVAICGDGKHVITAQRDRAITAWDATTGTANAIGTMTATTTACSPDGERIAAADLEGDIILIDRRADHRTGRVLKGSGDRMHVLAFSPDGTRLVGGGKGRRLHVWDLATGVVSVSPGHTGTITVLAFGPGERVASASSDGMVRVWNRDGTSIALRGHTGPVRSIAWSTRGDALVTASQDHSVRIWDLVSNASRALPGSDLFASFTSDERSVIAVDQVDGISWHADDLPRDEAGLRAWLADR